MPVHARSPKGVPECAPNQTTPCCHCCHCCHFHTHAPNSSFPATVAHLVFDLNEVPLIRRASNVEDSTAPFLQVKVFDSSRRRKKLGLISRRPQRTEHKSRGRRGRTNCISPMQGLHSASRRGRQERRRGASDPANKQQREGLHEICDRSGCFRPSRDLETIRL